MNLAKGHELRPWHFEYSTEYIVSEAISYVSNTRKKFLSFDPVIIDLGVDSKEIFMCTKNFAYGWSFSVTANRKPVVPQTGES